MEEEKVGKWVEDLFIFILFIYLFFCFTLLKTTKICFGGTKIEIFYREKAFHAGKKNQEKMTLPLRKIFLLRPWCQPSHYQYFALRSFALYKKYAAHFEDFTILRSCSLYYSRFKKQKLFIDNKYSKKKKKILPYNQAIQSRPLRGNSTPGPYFGRLCAFSQKIKQLWTKYSVDLVRNVPRNSKITVLFQWRPLLWSYCKNCAQINIFHVSSH